MKIPIVVLCKLSLISFQRHGHYIFAVYRCDVVEFLDCMSTAAFLQCQLQWIRKWKKDVTENKQCMSTTHHKSESLWNCFTAHFMRAPFLHGMNTCSCLWSVVTTGELEKKPRTFRIRDRPYETFLCRIYFFWSNLSTPEGAVDGKVRQGNRTSNF